MINYLKWSWVIFIAICALIFKYVVTFENCYLFVGGYQLQSNISHFNLMGFITQKLKKKFQNKLIFYYIMQAIKKYDLLSPGWGGLLPFNFIFCYRDVKNVCVCGSPSCIVRFDFSSESPLLKRSYCLFLYLFNSFKRGNVKENNEGT